MKPLATELTGAAGRDEPDSLTGLPRYDAFMSTLERAVARARKQSTSVSMALFDLDWFGRINKEHGLETGDAVLRLVARFLAEQFNGDRVVSRFGGDALAVLLPETEKEQAFLEVEQARNAFEGARSIEVAGKSPEVSLSLSAGVAAYPDDGANAAEVVRKANEAIYRAKVNGRNKACLARDEKMMTKTSYYAQGQLYGLSRLAKREGLNEAVLLREALDDLLRKYNA